MEKEMESKATSSSTNKLPISDDLDMPCYKEKDALRKERKNAEKHFNDQSSSASQASTSSSNCKLREVDSNSLRDEYNELICKSHYSTVQYECLKKEFTKLQKVLILCKLEKCVLATENESLENNDAQN